MGAMKNYLLDLQQVGNGITQQDAIEYAVLMGWFKPTYRLAADLLRLETELPLITFEFSKVCRENEQMEQARALEVVA